MTLRSSTLIMGLLLATAGVGAIACGSSEEESSGEELPADPPVRAQDPSTPAPIGSNTNSGSLPKNNDPASSGGTDGGTKEGGGGTGPGTGGGDGGGGGTGTGPGKLCQAGSVKEVEDNNTAGSATAVPAVTGSACGQLASKTDVDFFKFTLPADTAGFGMGLNYSKPGLKIEATANGKTFLVGGTPELEPGQEYIVKVSTTGDGPVDYRWDMEITK